MNGDAIAGFQLAEIAQQCGKFIHSHIQFAVGEGYRRLGFWFRNDVTAWNSNHSPCETVETRMSTERHLTAAISHDLAESLTPAQKDALQRAVAKIVALGEQTGVNADEMIELLKAGLTVGVLLEYLVARSGEVA